jgi:phosphatidate cytidylyltransferase
MLLQRVITALVLLPLLLGLIWFAPTPWLYAAFCGAGLLIAWEWTSLMRWTGSSPRRWAYLAATAVLLALAWLAPSRARWLPLLLIAASLWWVLVPLLFRGFPENLQKRPPAVLAMAALGLLQIVSTLMALATLHAMEGGIYKLLYLFFLVFAADTGAYLAGRNFGKHKLAPGISPGKTVEGAIGGLLLCAAWALTGGVFAFEVTGTGLFWLLGLSLLVAVVSIIGDLEESMFKRMVGIKDSGTLLPGHGGILDRVDSILAAAPVMVLGLLALGL